MNTGKGDPKLFSKIVRSYLGHNRLATNQLSDLITTVHQAIGQLGQAPEQEDPRIPAVSVRRSVTPEYVVCLDCGYRGKTLRRHISTRHGLTRDQYLQRWGLKGEHPLTAPAYSERRSSMAKTFGFGRKATVRVATTATVAIPAVAAPPVDVDGRSRATPTRIQRSRSRSKPADAVVAPSPTRR
jgi:predicted transcriptional regulator